MSVKATWVGASGFTLVDGTDLVPGETVCEIGAHEAADSDNWKPVRGDAKPKGDD